MDLNQVTNRLRPNKKPILKDVNVFLNNLNSELKSKKIDAAAVAGGSIAKDTFLKGDHDVDIFVKFNKKYPSDKLADHLQKALKKFRPDRIHGSRDYFQIKVKKLIFEIVPVYDISSPKEIVNVTDASPLHVDWAKAEINKKPELADEIRLAKAFCKAQDVYGAESYIRGFSGHVIDILVIHYGSFLRLLRNAVKWEPKVVIDFYDFHKGKALQVLNPSKTESPLILIDPIQPERNAAASLSNENFYKFTESADEFLKNPSAKFFEKKEFSLQELRKQAKGKKLLLLNVESLKGKEDIVGSKLLKSYSYIKNQLVINNFKVHDSGWNWDKKKKAVFWYIVDSKELPKTYNWEGPPLKAKNFVKLFRQKHKITFIKGNRIYAVVKRKFTKAPDIVRKLIKDAYVRDKVRRILLK